MGVSKTDINNIEIEMSIACKTMYTCIYIYIWSRVPVFPPPPMGWHHIYVYIYIYVYMYIYIHILSMFLQSGMYLVELWVANEDMRVGRCMQTFPGLIGTRLEPLHFGFRVTVVEAFYPENLPMIWMCFPQMAI